VYVSAVHPSVNDQCEETGPRFYVSIIEAAIRRGPAPRLPPALEELVWPRLKDRREPWITELGWTLVPPGCGSAMVALAPPRWCAQASPRGRWKTGTMRCSGR
ncbi:unnamed protein product, partial [Effrenium voratum]